jgi:hypothetical protein
MGVLSVGVVDGRAYLEQLIADRLTGSRDQPPGHVAQGFDVSEIRGVAVGLVAARALGQEEMEHIIADLEQRLDRLGWLTRTEFRVAAEPQLVPPLSVAARQQLALNSRLRWQEPVVDPPELEDVLSLAGRILVFSDAIAILLSLERWSTMFVLRLAYADPDRRLLRESMYASRARWHGWDDAGTLYRGRGVGACPGQGLYSERLVFEPGALPGARTLTLSVDRQGETQRLTVSLSAGPRWV